MSSRPWIGITTYGRNREGEYHLYAEYVDCVRRAGAVAVLLPPGEEDAESWLERLDGFVLTGGGDLDPRHYQSSTGAPVEEQDEERDLAELSLAAALLQRKPPVLAICRGMQLLNVVLGGTLHPHLPDAYGNSVNHRAPSGDPCRHPVACTANSSLRRTLRTVECAPLSWHHQALDRLGAGVRLVAWAPDQVVEAIEVEGFADLTAVQWHPELSAAHEPLQQRLFDRLVADARARRSRRSPGWSTLPP